MAISMGLERGISAQRSIPFFCSLAMQRRSILGREGCKRVSEACPRNPSRVANGCNMVLTQRCETQVVCFANAQVCIMWKFRTSIHSHFFYGGGPLHDAHFLLTDAESDRSRIRRRPDMLRVHDGLAGNPTC